MPILLGLIMAWPMTSQITFTHYSQFMWYLLMAWKLTSYRSHSYCTSFIGPTDSWLGVTPPHHSYIDHVVPSHMLMVCCVLSTHDNSQVMWYLLMAWKLISWVIGKIVARQAADSAITELKYNKNILQYVGLLELIIVARQTADLAITELRYNNNILQYCTNENE